MPLSFMLVPAMLHEKSDWTNSFRNEPFALVAVTCVSTRVAGFTIGLHANAKLLESQYSTVD